MAVRCTDRLRGTPQVQRGRALENRIVRHLGKSLRQQIVPEEAVPDCDQGPLPSEVLDRLGENHLCALRDLLVGNNVEAHASRSSRTLRCSGGKPLRKDISAHRHWSHASRCEARVACLQQRGVVVIYMCHLTARRRARLLRRQGLHPVELRNHGYRVQQRTSKSKRRGRLCEPGSRRPAGR